MPTVVRWSGRTPWFCARPSSGFSAMPYPAVLVVFPLFFSYVVYGDIRRGQLDGGGEDCFVVSRVCSQPYCGVGSVSGGQVSHDCFAYLEVGGNCSIHTLHCPVPSRPCRQKNAPKTRSISVAVDVEDRKCMRVARLRACVISYGAYM